MLTVQYKEIFGSIFRLYILPININQANIASFNYIFRLNDLYLLCLSVAFDLHHG